MVSKLSEKLRSTREGFHIYEEGQGLDPCGPRIIAAVRALEVELEQMKGERDGAIQERDELRQEWHSAQREVDATNTLLGAARSNTALWQDARNAIAAERDALAAKLEKVREWASHLSTHGAMFAAKSDYVRAARKVLSILNARSAPSGTPPKTEQREADVEQDLESIHEDVINQRIATALEACIEPLYAELEHGGAGHRIWLRAKFEDWFRNRVATYGVPAKGEAHPRATTPVSGSSVSQSERQNFSDKLALNKRQDTSVMRCEDCGELL